MSNQECLAQLVDGRNTEFEPMVNSIRAFLGELDALKHSVGGAIIFFKKKEGADGNLMMQVFPFKKNLPIFEDELVNDVLKIELFEKINQEKPYNEFWHYNQFKESYNRGNGSLEFKISNDILEYSNFTCVEDWEQFVKDVSKDVINKSKYEQILFASGCEKITLFHIPVFSTPSILLAIDAPPKLIGNYESFCRSLYFRLRDPIANYLYSRLIDSVTILNNTSNFLSEQKLVEAFVKRLCDVLLPISYQINDEEEVLYYSEWPKLDAENQSSYRIDLLGTKYNVVFKFTSFFYLNFDEGEYSYIHQTKIYESNLIHSSNLIQNLFLLIHGQWELMSDIQAKIFEGLKVQLDNINRNQISTTIESLVNLQEIFKNISLDTILSGSNFLKIEDTTVTLSIKGKEIIQKSYKEKSNILYGFRILKYLIENPNKKITPKELYEGNHISLKQPSEQKADDKKNDFGKRIEEIKDSILEWYSGSHDTKKEDEKLTILFVIHQVALELRIKKIPVQNSQISEIFNQVKTHIQDFKAANPERYKEFYDSEAVRKIKNELTKDLRNDTEENQMRNNVRDNIRAMAKCISKLALLEKGGQVSCKSSKLLLDHLIECEVIHFTNKGELEPLHTTEYCYSISKCTNYVINWEN